MIFIIYLVSTDPKVTTEPLTENLIDFTEETA
jgi:hypothetical protein